MNSRLSILILLIGLSVTSCRQEVTKLDPLQQNILESTVYADTRQIQSDKESLVLSENKVMSMSFVKEYFDSNKIDSLTYLRFNKNGQLIQRTTDELTSVGCLPHTYVQIFRYENNKIKRVESYTFKYKTKSVFEKWLETDTSRLKIFEWEDYTYSGDTIFIESGSGKWEYIKNKNGNLEGIFHKVKSTNEFREEKYSLTPFGVKKQFIYDGSTQIDYDYIVDENKVEIKSLNSKGYNRSENIYNSKGLLMEIIYYENNQKVARTKIDYTYYM
ncbi:MAG: hypothetical protein GXX85_10015 [Ignavibacteria bacterium]|nr:hypothetical protein [Ignavibacteria bacterium]